MYKFQKVKTQTDTAWKRNLGNWLRLPFWKDEKTEIRLPQTWEDVSTGQFLAIKPKAENQSEHDANTQVIAMLSRQAPELIQGLDNQVRNAMLQKLEFLSDLEALERKHTLGNETLLYSEFGRFLTAMDELKNAESVDFGVCLNVLTIYSMPSPFEYNGNIYRAFVDQFQAMQAKPITETYSPAIDLTKVIIEQAKQLNELEAPPPSKDQRDAGIEEFKAFGDFGLLYSLANSDLSKIPYIWKMDFRHVFKANLYQNKEAWYHYRIGKIMEKK